MPRTLTATLLSALLVLGAWLRWGMLDDGIAPDEFANLWHGGWTSLWAIAVDPESGVNPPLLRLLFNVPFDEPDTFALGRLFTWACGVASIGVAYELGRRASGGSHLAGLVSAVIVAVHPQSVKMAGRFRAYTPWVLTAGVHLVALDAWATARRAGDEEGARRWWPWLVGSAILLPQWHYVAVPVLLGLGLYVLAQAPLRRALVAYIAAAAAFLPLGAMVLTYRSTRVEHDTPLPKLFSTILSLDLRGALPLVKAWRPTLPEALRQDAEHAVLAIPIAILLMLCALLWSRQRPQGRLLLVGTAAVLLTVLAFSRIQLVRTPTVLMLLVFAGPLLAALPWTVPTSWIPKVGVVLPPLGAAALLVLLLPGTPDELDRTRTQPVYDALPRFAEEHRQWDDLRGDAPVRVFPAYTYVGLYYYLTHRHVRYMDGYGPSGCAPDEDGCFAEDGVRYLAVREGSEATPEGALVAWMGRPPDGFGDGCDVLTDERWYHVWWCPRRP